MIVIVLLAPLIILCFVVLVWFILKRAPNGISGSGMDRKKPVSSGPVGGFYRRGRSDDSSAVGLGSAAVFGGYSDAGSGSGSGYGGCSGGDTGGGGCGE
jgi:hypothetical protein